MSRRSSSLNNIDSGLSREIGSNFDLVRSVAERLTEITYLAGEDIAGLTTSLNEAKDFTGITVVIGATPGWDAVTKTLTVTTEKGEVGASLTLDSAVDNLNGTYTWNFSDGSSFTTSDLTGAQGIQGPKGDTGDALTITSVGNNADYTYTWFFSDGSQFTTTSLRGQVGPPGPQGIQGLTGNDLTVEQITYNGDGTFTWDFSDNTSYITPDLRGPQGATGLQGTKGDQGVSVHHIKGTSTTDLEGDFATAGERDTYTMYGDAAETINLGHFVVTNGLANGEDIGLMYRSTFDTDNSGIVDDAEAVGGKSLATIEAERDAAILAAQLALGTNYTVANNTEKSALTDLTVGDKVFVTDDGDTKWAHYLVTAIVDGLGSTSTFEVVMDEDTYLNANTAASIKTAYESNLDTNEFTDAEKAKVGFVSVSQAVDLDTIEADTALNNTHRTSDGSDHTFIDQDVTVAGTPSFASVQLTGGTGDQGKLSWNADEETLDLVTDGSITQIGQEVVVNVRNTSGVLIPNGTPVMFTGTIGNSGRITVSAMDGNTASAESLVGIATVDIADTAEGKAAYFGKVRGLDTTGASNGEVWVDGDILYIDPTNVGKLTKVKPSPGELLMAVAAVIHAHASGSLMIRAIPVDENHISEAVVASFYSKLELDAGQLDNRYYTETEIDLMLSLQNEASEITFDPSTSKLVSTDVQNALEEVQGNLETTEAELRSYTIKMAIALG